MNKKYLKKLSWKAVLVSSVLLIGFFSINFIDNNSSNFLDKVEVLNSKYSLVSVEILDDTKTDGRIAKLLNTDAFKVNILDYKKPTQKLILKIDNTENTPLSDMLVLSLQTDKKIDDIALEYSEVEGVLYAEQDYEIDLNATSKEIKTAKNEVERDDQNEKSIIAVIDSGLDMDHPDLQGKSVKGWNFVDGNQNVEDNVGHGTHVAGIISSNTGSALVMPVKFTDGKSGKLTNVIKSIKYAANNDADVINLSLGLWAESKALREAISYANEKGVIFVAAAGNYNSKRKYYPAAWDDVISVAAVDEAGKKTYISNFGEWVDFYALGQDVYSANIDGGYSYKTGTSQAAPLVSARIADALLEIDEDTFEKTYDWLVSHSRSKRRVDYGKMKIIK